MNIIPPLQNYWFEISDLSVFDAAFWMQTGGDPLEHRNRCDQDDAYQSHFEDHPGGADAVYEKCQVILSAIRVGLIKMTEEIRPHDYNLITSRTLIHKVDWLNWCHLNGYSELANRFEPHEVLECDSKPYESPSNGAGVVDHANMLPTLFDPVTAAVLEKMFPANGKWKKWSDKAKSNGLVEARVERAKFNPYKAAMWFLKQGVPGWDLARCNRTLANNLPARSKENAFQLTDQP